MSSPGLESPWTFAVKTRLRHYPWAFSMCRDLGYLGYALRLGLWRAVLGLPDRVESFGRQEVITWEMPFPAFSQAEHLAEWLQARGIQVKEGKYALYIPPQERLDDVLPSIAQFYPDNSGFKVLKNLRHPSRANYLYGSPEMQFLRARLTGSPQDQLITANYLHVLDIGPRAWDVCCWFADGTYYSVLVLVHIAGRTACHRNCADFLARLKELTRSSFLRIPVPAWETKRDFRNPDCAGNLLLPPGSSRPQYVDFQNFRLRHPLDWTRRIVQRAGREVAQDETEPSGRESGVEHPAIRFDGSAMEEINKRWKLVKATLERCGIDVNNRLVMDLGCGLGWMLQKALASGAAWALGWDDPRNAAHAEPMLFSLGATRFHILNGPLRPGHRLKDDVPGNLRPLLNESVLLCPAAAANSGIWQDLTKTPWRAIICHGHSAQREEDLRDRLRHIDPRGLCPVTAALLQRNSQSWRIAIAIRGDLQAAARGG